MRSVGHDHIDNATGWRSGIIVLNLPEHGQRAQASRMANRGALW
jgi:hypothetical protein